MMVTKKFSTFKRFRGWLSGWEWGSLLIILQVTSVACPAGTLVTHTLVHAGMNRMFLVYEPDPPFTDLLPLVFSLHGGGGNPTNMMASTTEFRWNELADQDRLLVCYPAGISNAWNDCRADANDRDPHSDDIGFFHALIDYFTAAYPLDTERVYASGHSNGGMMSQRLAIEISDRIAAIAISAGPLAASNECHAPVFPVSILYAPGTADPLVPFGGGPLNLPQGLNGGTVQSASNTVAFWTGFLATDSSPIVTNLLNTILLDGSTITRRHYRHGREGSEVLVYEVVGGGHGWPSPTQFTPAFQLIVGKKNQDVVFCDEAWAFFQRHTVNPLAVTQAEPESLSWQGVSEAIFYIEASTNLATWTLLDSVPGIPEQMEYALLPVTASSEVFRIRQRRE